MNGELNSEPGSGRRRWAVKGVYTSVLGATRARLSCAALKQWWSCRHLRRLLKEGDFDEIVRELSRVFDLPLQVAEALFLKASLSAIYPLRVELVRKIADLCWSEDPEIREQALEAAKGSPLILSLRPDGSFDDVS